MKKIDSLHILALAAHGTGLSGGDRIFIELARRWSRKFPVYIYVWEEGLKMLRGQRLGNPKSKIQNPKKRQRSALLKIKVSKLGSFCRFGFIICYLVRVLEGVRLGLTLKLKNESETYIYNASEFWMDSLPCVLAKIRYPKITWVATWYQTAPNPLKGFAEGEREQAYTLSAFLYWFAQLPVKPLISKFANKVIVNNKDEMKRFPKFTKRGDTIVLIGAVPLSDIERWLRGKRRIKKEYDAVFQGRFHPQKGVVELIDIWKKVVEKKPNAKLRMIGDGPLRRDVESRIADYGLQKNVKLFGYVFDGPTKYKLFSSGRVVVHPAFYDSGGMASAEAMAFGLPCVGFNLKAYESYYPKGMVKVKIGDKGAFAKQVLKLLDNRRYWERVAGEAEEMIEANWSWNKRADQILRLITAKRA